MPNSVSWDRFSHDPRVADNADQRVSDADRHLVLEVLADAYAEGRVTKAEFDQRTDTVNATETFGTLLLPIRDLVKECTAVVPAATNDAAVLRKAEQHYHDQRRTMLHGLIWSSGLCWVIWIWTLVQGQGTPWPWPVFVMFASGSALSYTLMNKEKIVRDKVAELEARRPN